MKLQDNPEKTIKPNTQNTASIVFAHVSNIKGLALTWKRAVSFDFLSVYFISSKQYVHTHTYTHIYKLLMQEETSKFVLPNIPSGFYYSTASFLMFYVLRP